MLSGEIRKKFLAYFEQRGHAVVSSSSLIPDDPSVLLTTAGMQQFKRYFTGELDALKDFGAKNAVSIQKCFRTSDIDEVGDERHLTFFEMLGNFSFDGYRKEKAIRYAHEFITSEKWMHLKIDYVTVFEGENAIAGASVPPDEESEKVWKSLGVRDIRRCGRGDNFWGPTGSEGPCGPTTEIYIDGIEVWNIVFNQYYQYKDKTLRLMDFQGIDTGMGLERLAMVSQKVGNVFETDLFTVPFISSGSQAKRIIADHIRSSVFLIADGVRPANKYEGYILRRLIRRAIVQLGVEQYGLPQGEINDAVSRRIESVIDFYSKEKDYSYLFSQQEEILKVFLEEGKRFSKTLEAGLREFNKQYPRLSGLTESDGFYRLQRVGQIISGETVFYFHQTFGLTVDIVKDLAKERVLQVDEGGFWRAFKKHQEISRAGKEAKFGGHGLYLKTGEVTVKDESELEKVTRLHTATHLMHAGLRAVLGSEVQQKGSDITFDRTRFDFNFPRKVTAEELKEVEEWVNNAIKKNLKVEWHETSYEEAIKEGALGFFRQKYPPRVKVYSMFSASEVYSKELCGGPHVTETGKVGMFKIVKEENVGAGVRRIRGVIEP